MNDTTKESDQLRKLERLRTLELEHAQLEHVLASEVAEHKRQAVERTQTTIAETQSFAREQCEGTHVLSPDALMRIHEFSKLQSRELESAEQAWRDSQQQCDAALGQVVARFESLSVIERLRQRRELEASKQSAMREQKRLDEHALAHLAAGDVGTVNRGGN